MSIDDFNILKPISRGAFGRVYLAEKKSTGERGKRKREVERELLTDRKRESVRWAEKERGGKSEGDRERKGKGSFQGTPLRSR